MASQDPTMEQMQGEAKALHGRTDSILREFYDGYLVIGVRAGGSHVMHVDTMATITRPQRERLEDAILEWARTITKRRLAKQRRKAG